MTTEQMEVNVRFAVDRLAREIGERLEKRGVIHAANRERIEATVKEVICDWILGDFRLTN